MLKFIEGDITNLKNNLAASQTDKERAVKIAIQKLIEAHLASNSAESIIC